MNWDKLLVIGRDRDSFKALVGRKIRERRQDERQFAEHRTDKASAPSEKLMRCRCKKLSRCSTIARARCCTIPLESTNSREAVQ